MHATPANPAVPPASGTASARHAAAAAAAGSARAGKPAAAADAFTEMLDALVEGGSEPADGVDTAEESGKGSDSDMVKIASAPPSTPESVMPEPNATPIPQAGTLAVPPAAIESSALMASVAAAMAAVSHSAVVPPHAGTPDVAVAAHARPTDGASVSAPFARARAHRYARELPMPAAASESVDASAMTKASVAADMGQGTRPAGTAAALPQAEAPATGASPTPPTSKSTAASTSSTSTASSIPVTPSAGAGAGAASGMQPATDERAVQAAEPAPVDPARSNTAPGLAIAAAMASPRAAQGLQTAAVRGVPAGAGVSSEPPASASARAAAASPQQQGGAGTPERATADLPPAFAASMAAASNQAEGSGDALAAPAVDHGAPAWLPPERVGVPLPAPALRADIAAHPQSAAFGAELSTQLRLMIEGGVQTAELHLHPADLGPIQIQLQLNDQVAQIHFEAAHASTREGIEKHLPELREMLAREGLSLGQANVGSGQSQAQTSAGGQGHTHSQTAPAPGQSHPGARAASSTSTASGTPPARAARGMLDLYA